MISRARLKRWTCKYLALRVFILSVAPAFIPHPAHAFVTGAASDSTFGAFMENMINWKATQLGTYTAAEAAAMPAALDVGVGGVVTEGLTGSATAVAVGTPVGWLALAGIAAGVGVVAGTTYCITQGCSLSWLFGSSSAISQPENNGPDITKGAQYFTASYGNYTYYGSAPDDAISAVVQMMNTNSYGGNTTWQTAVSTGTCNATNGGKCYSVTTRDGKVAGATVVVNGSASGSGFQGSCVGVSAATAISASGCTGGISPTMMNGPVGDPITEAQMVPLKYGSVTVAPNVLADVANEAWRLAAAQQGYQGLPYSTGTKITAQDVTAYEQTIAPSSIPTVGSAVAPVASPGTVTAPSTSGGAKTMSGTVSLPSTSTQGGTTTTTSPSSGSSSGSSTGTTTTTSTSTPPPCGNQAAGEPACEVDWNPTGATQTNPTAPDYNDIFTALLKFSGLSFWKSWTVTVPPGQCSVFTIALPSIIGGGSVPFDICTPLSSMQGLIQGLETTMILITSILIVLGA